MTQSSDARPSAVDTPYVDALLRYVTKGVLPFHTPGHKQGRGAHRRLVRLLGRAALRADLSDVAEAPAFQNDFVNVLSASERMAARAFGAARTRFLANGTTSGIHAMLWAACGPGDRVLVARDAHRSVFGGLALVGARPVYVPVETHPEWGISLGVNMDKLSAALDRYPDARAVLLTSPNYYGVATDVEAVAALVHARGIPLLVDQAHGPHFRFHPSLPPSAQESGADLVADSTHKWLGGLTQASMLHVVRAGGGEHGDGDLAGKAERAVDLLQSTSPSPLLFASLDAARAQMEEEGFALLDRALALARKARRRIQSIPGFRVLEERDVAPGGLEADGGSEGGKRPGRRLDPTKLWIRVSDAGWTGPDADVALRQTEGIQVEMHDPDHILALVTIGDTEETVDALVDGLARLSSPGPRPASRPRREGYARAYRRERSGGRGFATKPAKEEGTPYEPELAPGAAARAEARRVPRERAEGSIAAETITPYPPGIPVWTAGERITAEALGRIDEIVRVGGLIRGASDASLETLRVVREDGDKGGNGGERRERRERRRVSGRTRVVE